MQAFPRRIRRFWPLIAILAGLTLVRPASCASPNNALEGRVTLVADGDTVTLIDHFGAKHKIRLLGIDTPELQQAHGKAAKRWLSQRVLQEVVKVQVVTVDRYGRKIGKILMQPAQCTQAPCPYNADINLELVQQGHAWWYERYRHNQPETDWLLYEKAQSQARAEKRGLWNAPSPVAPWDWRQHQRINKP